MNEQENQENIKTLDKILGAGFKSIDLNEQMPYCDFGDTAPFNELTDKFQNYGRKEFSNFETIDENEDEMEIDLPVSGGAGTRANSLPQPPIMNVAEPIRVSESSVSFSTHMSLMTFCIDTSKYFSGMIHSLSVGT